MNAMKEFGEDIAKNVDVFNNYDKVYVKDIIKDTPINIKSPIEIGISLTK